MKNALILLAGGSGKRTRLKVPKQFLRLGNTNLLEYFLQNLDENIFEIIIIASKIPERKKYLLQERSIKHDRIFRTKNSSKTANCKVRILYQVLNSTY